MKINHGCFNFVVLYVLYTMGRLNNNAEIYRSPCRGNGIFQLVADNTRLDASVTETVVAHTLLMCSMKCIADVLCKSLNYNAKTKGCEKLSGTRLADGKSKLIAANSWGHYEPVEIKVMALHKRNVQCMEKISSSMLS